MITPSPVDNGANESPAAPENDETETRTKDAVSVSVSFTSDLHRGYSNKTDRLQRKYFSSFEQPDVFILAGDIASHGTPNTQWNGMFRVLRDNYPSIPILAVRGNHDFWFSRYNESLKVQNQVWSKTCADWDVINLEGKVHEINGVTFAGWLSWWQGRAPDQHQMSAQVHTREMLDLERDTYSSMLHQLDGKVADIYVTHMAPGDSHWTSSATYFPPGGALICGHTHVNRDEMLRRVRIFNSGPDYDCPNAQTIFVDKGLEPEFWQLEGKQGKTRVRYE